MDTIDLLIVGLPILLILIFLIAAIIVSKVRKKENQAVCYLGGGLYCSARSRLRFNYSYSKAAAASADRGKGNAKLGRSRLF